MEGDQLAFFQTLVGFFPYRRSALLAGLRNHDNTQTDFVTKSVDKRPLRTQVEI